MAEKKSSAKDNRFKSYLVVVLLIIAAVVISLLFYKQKIETTKEVNVFKNITADWQTFKDEKHGFSFNYPKDWTVKSMNEGLNYEIQKNDGEDNSMVSLKISGQRSINIPDAIYAIQISIPFDKKNYLIFSTSTDSKEKEIFYNIPVTLKIGK